MKEIEIHGGTMTVSYGTKLVAIEGKIFGEHTRFSGMFAMTPGNARELAKLLMEMASNFDHGCPRCGRGEGT